METTMLVVKRNPETVWDEIESDFIILLTSECKMYQINKVGKEIWLLVENEMSVDEIIDKLFITYPMINAERIICDTQEYIKVLLEKSLLMEVNNA